MSRVVSMVLWRAFRLMGREDGFSRSSEREMVPGVGLEELGLLPKSRVAMADGG